MYMKNSKSYQDLMKGNTVLFTQYELWNILSHQHEFKINTLHVQKTLDGRFVCRVDEPTIKVYKMNEEGQI